MGNVEDSNWDTTHHPLYASASIDLPTRLSTTFRSALSKQLDRGRPIRRLSFLPFESVSRSRSIAGTGTFYVPSPQTGSTGKRVIKRAMYCRMSDASNAETDSLPEASAALKAFPVRVVNPATCCNNGVTSGILMLIGLLAGFFPARKAARVDPVESLRYE